MVSKKITVLNESGFHIRPASEVAKAAEACSSKVEIIYKHNIINAKSLLNILSVSIKKGAEIELCCSGPEEKEDLEALTDLILHLEK